MQVTDKNLREIKNEILKDYAGEFEMVGRLKNSDQTRETHIRVRKIDDFESFITAFDQDHESEDAIFNGFIYRNNTPQFNLVNRSQYRKGCHFKHEIIEYRGNICSIPTKEYCFVNYNFFQNR